MAPPAQWLRRQLAFPPGVRVVATPVAVGGALLLVYAAFTGGLELSASFLILLVAAALAEAFPVPIESVPAGTTSFATVFIAATAATHEWRNAAVVGGAAMLTSEIAKRQRLAMAGYNVGLYTIAGAAAGIVAQPIPEDLRLGLVSSLAFYVVDVSLLSLVLSRVKREPLLRVLGSFFRSTLAPFLVMAALTLITVQLWQANPWWSLALVPPLTMIVAYQRRLSATLEKQREFDRLKDEFIATTSHELRTPLTAIYGNAMTLAERELPDDIRQLLIQSLKTESERLTSLVDEILWASRVAGKRMVYEPEVIDAREVIREIVALEQGRAPAGTHVVDESSDVGAVVADPKHLHRVLVNLIDNAIKYSPDGGTIAVSCDDRGAAVQFTVADQGVGIPPEKREEIFDKFTRLDPSMGNGVGGTGLGLYIVHSAIEGMGGRIWVEANEPRGSRFVFDLPRPKPIGDGPAAVSAARGSRFRRSQSGSSGIDSPGSRPSSTARVIASSPNRSRISSSARSSSSPR